MIEQQIQLLNFVANQPEVRRGIAPGLDSIDLSSWFDDKQSCIYGNEHGLAIFKHIGDGLYEGHYLFTDALDRRDGVRLLRRAFTDLFTNRGASAINGATPRHFHGARAMNRALGLVPVGTCVDHARRECIEYRLERDKWVP